MLCIDPVRTCRMSMLLWSYQPRSPEIPKVS